jgi:hypothetical protein
MLPGGKMAFVYIIPLVLGDWYLRRDERRLNTPSRFISYSIMTILYVLILLNFGAKTSFIYFQF